MKYHLVRGAMDLVCSSDISYYWDYVLMLRRFTGWCRYSFDCSVEVWIEEA